MSNLRLKSSFHRKWRNSLTSARTQGEKEIGNEATNSVSKFPRWVGKCATRKMVQGSRAVAHRDSAERARTHFQRSHARRNNKSKVRLGDTPKPTRGTRVLPRKM